MAKQQDWKYTRTRDGEYIKIKDTKVNYSIELRDGLVIDIDPKGNIRGIEIIK